MDGLDLLGAGDLLADQYVTIRVTNIDKGQLANKLGGAKGSIASSALTMVDFAPKAAIDLVVPYLKNTAKEYGVDTEIMVAKAPPAKKRAFSEFWAGLFVGGVLGGAGLLIYKGVSQLVNR